MNNDAIIVDGISSKIVNEIEEMVDSKTIRGNLNFLGRGCFGQVFALDNYAIKVFDYKDDDLDDALKLEILQGDLFPKLYAYKKGKFMISERIMSRSLDDYDRYEFIELHSNFAQHIITIIEFTLSKGLLALDLQNKNIMIKNGLPIVVDIGNFQKNKDNRFDLAFDDSESLIRATCPVILERLQNFYQRHCIDNAKSKKYEFIEYVNSKIVQHI